MIQPHGALFFDEVGSTATVWVPLVSAAVVVGVVGAVEVTVSATVVVSTRVVVGGCGRVAVSSEAWTVVSGRVGTVGSDGRVGAVTSGRVNVTSDSTPLGTSPEKPGTPLPLPHAPRR
jgi:hypothetical protein